MCSLTNTWSRCLWSRRTICKNNTRHKATSEDKGKFVKVWSRSSHKWMCLSKNQLPSRNESDSAHIKINDCAGLINHWISWPFTDMLTLLSFNFVKDVTIFYLKCDLPLLSSQIIYDVCITIKKFLIVRNEEITWIHHSFCWIETQVVLTEKKTKCMLAKTRNYTFAVEQLQHLWKYSNKNLYAAVEPLSSAQV